MASQNRKGKSQSKEVDDEVDEAVPSKIDERTSIQLSPSTRDRLYKLKFRRTYDQFVNELLDLYESHMAEDTR
jgi:hypothetical protein